MQLSLPLCVALTASSHRRGSVGCSRCQRLHFLTSPALMTLNRYFGLSCTLHARNRHAVATSCAAHGAGWNVGEVSGYVTVAAAPAAAPVASQVVKRNAHADTGVLCVALCART